MTAIETITGRDIGKSTGRWILAENLLVAVIAWYQGLNMQAVLWLFWWQSIIIGWFNYRRMLALKQFSTKNLKMNDKPVAEDEASKRKVANFFLLHFGFFHLVYLVFLLSSGAPQTVGLPWLIISILSFWFTHRHNYYALLEADTRHKHNIGTMMFLPYLRVLPMHLAIILGQAVSGLVFWIFMALKTLADWGMHVMLHRWLARDKS